MTQEEARKAWIEDLRSGKHKQGKHNLHCLLDDSWCCLGRLCDLVADELKLERSIDSSMEYFNGNCTTLSDEVVKFIGLTDDAGTDKVHNWITLTSLNDNSMTFAEIADKLETGNYWA